MRSSVDPSRLPRQQRSRQSLERILAAAEQVLARDGADGFTVAAVAALSRVSIGGIYRRFDGRDTLLLAVKHRVLSELGDKVSVAADGAASLDEAVERFTRGESLRFEVSRARYSTNA